MIFGVDENRRGYSLKAPGPGGSGSAMRLPGRGTFPNVDDHLVEPEVTRDEIIGGRRVVASPAETAHADQHSRLDYVLQAHVATGYRVSVDLITRHGEVMDFASDACVRREGTDPATGRRYLEEIAFEVVSEQREKLATEKAEQMGRRGVRRIFAIWVKSGEVGEWSSEDQAWRRLEAGAKIDDVCLVKPLEVAALLDAAVADNAVVEALAAKGNSAIRARDAAAEARGVARSILDVLEARAVSVTEAQRQQILRRQDLERLSLWLRRAVTASSAAEVLAEP
ncbi:MAG: hypothetical protein ABJC13_10675 [Acidobacteriota bacterium]